MFEAIWTLVNIILLVLVICNICYGLVCTLFKSKKMNISLYKEKNVWNMFTKRKRKKTGHLHYPI